MEQTNIDSIPDDLTEALRATVMRLGGAKRIGQLLWPEKEIHRAAIDLDNALNRDRAEKLSLEQVDLIIAEGRKAGCHAVMQYLGSRHSYEVRPIEPEDERARLQREFIDHAKQLEQIAAQLGHVLPALKAVG